MTQEVADRFKALHRLVGNTPLLAIDVRYRGEARRVYAKHESLSLTGSVKDRMALFVLEEAYRAGRIQPGDRIAEATSGNTGISFAALGRDARPSGDDLHAGLDEPRAHGPHRQLRRRRRPGQPRSGRVSRQHRARRRAGRVGPARVSAAPVLE